MIIIKDAYFDSYEEFADCIVDTYEDLCENEEFSSVDVIAKFGVAKEIVKELVSNGYDIALINNFTNVESDGYKDEFIVSLSDNEIWVEPFKRGNDYITAKADVVYIMDDCNCKCIPNISSDKIYEVEVDLDDKSDDYNDDETKNKVKTKSDYYDDLADSYFKLALIKALDDLDYLLRL